jgi:2-dehydropantoate 2-reductase
MRIAIMAAGAVGGYFGARLAAAGEDVHFIARGAHLEAIRKAGLKLDSDAGNLHLPKVNVTDDAATVGPVDIVLFAVKLWDTEHAAELTRPLLGRETAVITLQNGIDSVERLDPILGAEHVVGGITYISTTISMPGVIHHLGKLADIVCGERDGKPSARLTALAGAAKKAGFQFRISPNIDLDRWRKFVFLSSFAGATALTRQPIGPIMADADMREFARALFAESTAVARAQGFAFPNEFVDRQMAMAAHMPAAMKASMAQDLERGGRLEVEWLSGAVARIGRTAGVPTPAHAAVYAALKPFRLGTPR